MKKLLLIMLLIIGCTDTITETTDELTDDSLGRSTSMISTNMPSVYNVGETVSESHQNMTFDVCYGEYPNDELKLADFNGELNGGDYQVLFINMAASW